MIQNNITISTSHNITFGTTYKKVMSKTQPFKIDHESSTQFFKFDFEWNKFFDHIVDTGKTYNIYSLCSSDCSEAYSIALILKAKLGNKFNEFPKIIAVDNDENVLKLAQNGFIDLSLDDELKINQCTDNQLNKYLERTNYTYLTDKIGATDRQEYLTRYKILPELKDSVEIVCEDIQDFIPKINTDNNNIIFCRNCWVYFKDNVNQIAKMLSEKVNKDSYLAIGNYDNIFCPMNKQNLYGFYTNPNFYNIFDKSSNDYNDVFRPIRSPHFKF